MNQLCENLKEVKESQDAQRLHGLLQRIEGYEEISLDAILSNIVLFREAIKIIFKHYPQIEQENDMQRKIQHVEKLVSTETQGTRMEEAFSLLQFADDETILHLALATANHDPKKAFKLALLVYYSDHTKTPQMGKPWDEDILNFQTKDEQLFFDIQITDSACTWETTLEKICQIGIIMGREEEIVDVIKSSFQNAADQEALFHFLELARKKVSEGNISSEV